MTATQIRLWTVEEYHQMIEAGILTEDDKVELLEGRIVQMSPQGTFHAGTTQRSDEYLKNRLRGLASVRIQLPITLTTSEPEPDLAIVRIDPNFYCDRHPHPEDIFLLIEIAFTTFHKDYQEKAPIYARGNIPEYWLLNVSENRAYIFRDPSPSGYQSEQQLNTTETIVPLAFPDLEVSLSQLFPPQR
ncbi:MULTISPECIES: Uma2 family endonuclease [Spirulina sp. CCY15215]|uniref:Uma2 family endonuclease n=1 Tax=Spirulina sp. CCY15215 TaxID=2767591 RepID=UPI00194EFC2E|nr:Uma2 family endonuclease [Spirulina major]